MIGERHYAPAQRARFVSAGPEVLHRRWMVCNNALDLSIVRRFQSSGFVPRNLPVTLLLVHQGVSSG
jgi:hypothetical protein